MNVFNLAKRTRKNFMKMYKSNSNRRPIGFLADRYLVQEEKKDECKLVAQKELTFASENKN